MLAKRIWFSTWTLRFCHKIIFDGSHLEFFRICNMGMTYILLVCFIRFFDHENIDLDTKIMIPCKLELEIFSKSDFRCSQNPYRAPIFFSGNIVNIIHRRVVRVHEDQFWPMDHLCQL